MSKPKLVAEDGSVIFEFESDRQMRSLLFNTIHQAKHGSDVRLQFVRNGVLNDLLQALRENGIAAGDKQFATMPQSIEEQVTWTPPTDVTARVLREIFDYAPDLVWWELREEEKQRLITDAFVPYRLSEENLQDYVETIDHWISRFRR